MVATPAKFETQDCDEKGIPEPTGPTNQGAFWRFVDEVQGLDSIIARGSYSDDPEYFKQWQRQRLSDAFTVLIHCTRATGVLTDTELAAKLMSYVNQINPPSN